LPAAHWKDGNDHTPGSGAFARVVQTHLTVSDHVKDVKVEPVNHYGLNLYNRHGKLIATAPKVDGLWVLNHVLD
jgi:hypothetical protein